MDARRQYEIDYYDTEETLADRRHFGLNAEQWEAFMMALDAPPRELPRIKRLFSEKSVFENDTSN